MKTKLLPIILWIIAFCWMGMIFFLSSQTGVQTAETSSGIAEKAAGVIYTQPTEQQINCVHMDLRRFAHISLFFVFGGLLFAATKASFNTSTTKNYWLSGIIAALIISSCGFFDEWHKQFIAGRHFNTGEALLNIICGIAGILFVAIIAFLINGYIVKYKK